MPMGFIPKPDSSWPLWVAVLYWIVTGIVILAVAGFTIVKTFPYLKRGRAGLLCRKGIPIVRKGQYVRKGPGIHVVVPFLYTIEDESLLIRVTKLSSVLAENGKKQYAGEARPTWSIIDSPQGLFKSLFKAEDLEEVVETATMCALGVAIENCKDPRDRDEVIELAKKECSKTLKKGYGVKLDSFGLVSVVRVPFQVLSDALNGVEEAEQGEDTPRVAIALAAVGGTTMGPEVI